jgi:hypothetical protein
MKLLQQLMQAARVATCRYKGHRWRPRFIVGIVSEQELFDWRGNREPATPCTCLRCGAARPMPPATQQQAAGQ